MGGASLHTVCPECGAVNRVPQSRLGSGGKCGACHRPLFPGRPVSLGDERFQRAVGREQLPVVVDFWADWCGPCKAMAPVFEQISAELASRVRFVKVDVDAAPATAQRYGIRSIPTLAIFRDGKQIASRAGVMPGTELRAWVEQTIA